MGKQQSQEVGQHWVVSDTTTTYPPVVHNCDNRRRGEDIILV